MRRILVNCTHRETRAAVLENGKLVEFLMERHDEQRMLGNIYKGKVTNILPGMQAAFVDIGTDKNGFLYIDDCLSPDWKEKETKRKPSIREVLTKGQEVLVQVTKEPIGTKGARLTTQLAFPGRFLVYMPEGKSVGVSRRIDREGERERLRSLAESLCEGQEGAIVRTVAEGASEQEVQADFLFLRGLWQKVKAKILETKPLKMVYQDLDLVSRMARDFLTEDTDEFVVDSSAKYHHLIEQLDYTAPGLKGKIKLYNGRISLFDQYEVEAEIEKALKRKVWLKSGGYLVIDQTEALTVIDINTGKFVGSQNLEETVFKTNMEAAGEIARQLRIRDIGGIIVIDFIDMRKEEDRGAVLRQLEKELQKDRTKSHILGFTQLGLLEMTRKKVRQNLSDMLTKPCPTCDGRGKILSEETIAAKAERDIKEYSRGRDVEAILIEGHPQVLSVLQGNKNENVKRMESEWGIRIYLKTNESMHPQHYHIAYVGSETEAKRRVDMKK